MPARALAHPLATNSCRPWLFWTRARVPLDVPGSGRWAAVATAALPARRQKAFLAQFCEPCWAAAARWASRCHQSRPSLLFAVQLFIQHFEIGKCGPGAVDQHPAHCVLVALLCTQNRVERPVHSSFLLQPAAVASGHRRHYREQRRHRGPRRRRGRARSCRSWVRIRVNASGFAQQCLKCVNVHRRGRARGLRTVAVGAAGVHTSFFVLLLVLLLMLLLVLLAIPPLALLLAFGPFLALPLSVPVAVLCRVRCLLAVPEAVLCRVRCLHRPAAGHCRFKEPGC